MEAIRREHMQKTLWGRAQIDTIQKAVIKIGARVRQLRQKVKIHLLSSYPWTEALIRAWESVWAT